MTHHETSVFDKNFLNTIEQWFAARNDVFVVARFSRKAGEKAYFWFEKFSSFRAQLDLFPPETDSLFPFIFDHVSQNGIKTCQRVMEFHQFFI